ncbi:hypothetical protein KBY84_06195 [Cyanobium sp. N.Huapi 1H5]|uniref:hypothetical protein n=1 Tax=Cyanobium sp. N.Huapi 1H5 TaxID=2823719 RepID=UPI0020CF2788|nr:hypothetical protein [Cyanobium sp. N.Huapi 1H5]MCP9837087.1 hypothetical protein [Cyanobium sp. N.Huapi 1H5]
MGDVRFVLESRPLFAPFGMAPPQAGAMALIGTASATDGKPADAGASGGSGGGELLTDVGALVIAAALVGVVLLVRRWLMLRSRQPLPGLPKERVLPLSRHGTLHDPKYLGRILEAEEPPTGP